MCRNTLIEKADDRDAQDELIKDGRVGHVRDGFHKLFHMSIAKETL